MTRSTAPRAPTIRTRVPAGSSGPGGGPSGIGDPYPAMARADGSTSIRLGADIALHRLFRRGPPPKPTSAAASRTRRRRGDRRGGEDQHLDLPGEQRQEPEQDADQAGREASQMNTKPGVKHLQKQQQAAQRRASARK